MEHKFAFVGLVKRPFKSSFQQSVEGANLNLVNSQIEIKKDLDLESFSEYDRADVIPPGTNLLVFTYQLANPISGIKGPKSETLKRLEKELKTLSKELKEAANFEKEGVESQLEEKVKKIVEQEKNEPTYNNISRLQFQFLNYYEKNVNNKLNSGILSNLVCLEEAIRQRQTFTINPSAIKTSRSTPGQIVIDLTNQVNQVINFGQIKPFQTSVFLEFCDPEGIKLADEEFIEVAGEKLEEGNYQWNTRIKSRTWVDWENNQEVEVNLIKLTLTPQNVEELKILEGKGISLAKINWDQVRLEEAGHKHRKTLNFGLVSTFLVEGYDDWKTKRDFYNSKFNRADIVFTYRKLPEEVETPSSGTLVLQCKENTGIALHFKGGSIQLSGLDVYNKLNITHPSKRDIYLPTPPTEDGERYLFPRVGLDIIANYHFFTRQTGRKDPDQAFHVLNHDWDKFGEFFLFSQVETVRGEINDLLDIISNWEQGETDLASGTLLELLPEVSWKLVSFSKARPKTAELVAYTDNWIWIDELVSWKLEQIIRDLAAQGELTKEELNEWEANWVHWKSTWELKINLSHFDFRDYENHENDRLERIPIESAAAPNQEEEWIRNIRYLTITNWNHPTSTKRFDGKGQFRQIITGNLEVDRIDFSLVPCYQLTFTGWDINSTEFIERKAEKEIILSENAFDWVKIGIGFIYRDFEEWVDELLTYNGLINGEMDFISQVVKVRQKNGETEPVNFMNANEQKWFNFASDRSSLLNYDFLRTKTKIEIERQKALYYAAAELWSLTEWKRNSKLKKAIIAKNFPTYAETEKDLAIEESIEKIIENWFKFRKNTITTTPKKSQEVVEALEKGWDWTDFNTPDHTNDYRKKKTTSSIPLSSLTSPNNNNSMTEKKNQLIYEDNIWNDFFVDPTSGGYLPAIKDLDEIDAWKNTGLTPSEAFRVFDKGWMNLTKNCPATRDGKVEFLGLGKANYTSYGVTSKNFYPEKVEKSDLDNAHMYVKQIKEKFETESLSDLADGQGLDVWIRSLEVGLTSKEALVDFVEDKKPAELQKLRRANWELLSTFNQLPAASTLAALKNIDLSQGGTISDPNVLAAANLFKKCFIEVWEAWEIFNNPHSPLIQFTTARQKLNDYRKYKNFSTNNSEEENMRGKAWNFYERKQANPAKKGETLFANLDLSAKNQDNQEWKNVRIKNILEKVILNPQIKKLIQLQEVKTLLTYIEKAQTVNSFDKELLEKLEKAQKDNNLACRLIQNCFAWNELESAINHLKKLQTTAKTEPGLSREVKLTIGLGIVTLIGLLAITVFHFITTRRKNTRITFRKSN